MSGETYISQAANAGSFEILVVQFVNGNFKVAGGFKLDEPESC